MSAEATIVTAIHNIKSNHGSETPGVDSKTMRKDYLQRSHSWVIRDIQSAFKHFEPQKIRRKYIDKPGKAEKTSAGDPYHTGQNRAGMYEDCTGTYFRSTILCPLYGFRPMRDTVMALERIKRLSHTTGHYWIVEGEHQQML